MKQGCKDLYVMNYRHGGLAAKNCKTQNQCPQIRKSLELDLKKTTGGAGLKRCNRSRGFSAKFARHTKNSGNRFPWWLAPTVGRIPSDSGHGRARRAGQKKEDDEGIRFWGLPAARTHRGSRNLAGKGWRRSVPRRRRCSADGGAQERGRQGGPRAGGRRVTPRKISNLNYALESSD
jgi:hypothetical protein